jgi:hypothetical protein
MLPKIISFSGRKQSGKTELAKICVKYNYELINFADGLKDLICNVLNINREYLDENKDKISDNKYYLNDKIDYIANEICIDPEIVKTFFNEPFDSIRSILQIIGTNLIRQYNPLWHINKIKQKIYDNPDKYYCIGDTRFLNEKQTVEELNGQCWFIIRPTALNISNHNSEISLLWTDFDDNIIINNVNKEEFISRWENYMFRLIKTSQITTNFNSYFKHNLTWNFNINHNINKKAFLNITNESAFIMGVLASKGKFQVHNYNIKIDLGTTNTKILEIYNKILDSDRNNEDYDNPFIIENIKLWDCINQKVPILLKSNTKYAKYWITGLIDWEYTHKHYIHILNSKEIIEYIHNVLGFGIQHKLNDNLYQLTFVGDDYINLHKSLSDCLTLIN